jgi:hypothetical protein
MRGFSIRLLWFFYIVHRLTNCRWFCSEMIFTFFRFCHTQEFIVGSTFEKDLDTSIRTVPTTRAVCMTMNTVTIITIKITTKQ